jgi:hypothetical protein
MNMFKFFLAYVGGRAVSRTPASMRRTSKVCFWIMVVFLILSLIPIVLMFLLAPVSKDAPAGIAILVFGLTLPIAGYGFLGWIYFRFMSWIASA